MRAVFTLLFTSTLAVTAFCAEQQSAMDIPPARPGSTFGARAEIVVYARVLDSHAFVRAGSKQKYVYANQGWAAIKIEVVRVEKGSVAEKITWIDNVKVASAWPKFERDYRDNAFYYFALNRIDDLSKWCETEVFALAGVSPDPIREVINAWDKREMPNQSSQPTRPTGG